MATPDILKKDKDLLLYASIFEGDAGKSRGSVIERKIEILEGLTSNVSNRRSRRLLNDRLLMELVPRLNAEEIRGLFAPPPWGEEAPVSAFCMENMSKWDKFRNVDMDKEANIIKSSNQSSQRRKSHVDTDKLAALNAWHRIDCRTREALRRSSLVELIDSYEKCVRTFIQEGNDSDGLGLQVQDPFHRLLLHGVCEVRFGQGRNGFPKNSVKKYSKNFFPPTKLSLSWIFAHCVMVTSLVSCLGAVL